MNQAAAPSPPHPLRQILIDLAVMGVIGVFLGLIGPFGSINQPLAIRLLYWVTFAFAGYAIYRPMGALVDLAHRALNLPTAPLWLVAVLIATVPMAVLVHAVQAMPEWPRMMPPDQALVHYASVFVIGGAVTMLFQVLGARSGGVSPVEAQPEPRVEADAAQASPQSQPAVSQQTAVPNPLLDQLPAELGSSIIALEMEDHYVRVHTALGSALVLMRLRDAMALIADQEGMQVHRSWWVARAAVEDVVRDGRNVRLKLARDIEAPVARANVAALRDARWI